jgi:hypothetical protein
LIFSLVFNTPQANGLQLLARARYNNTAEARDELSFKKGDIVTVLRKDHNNQVDWWLCELRGKRGMVPANYFEIFHEHDTTATYDIPRPSSKTSSHSSRTTPLPPHPVTTTTTITNTITPGPNETDDQQPLYDFPPADDDDVIDATDKDYDMPPDEIDGIDDDDGPTYDRPPSAARLSPQIMQGGRITPSSNRSSLKSSNRVSNASSIGSGQGIYDVPPDLADVYNFPKPNQPARGFEEDNRISSVSSNFDISKLTDSEADKLLTDYHHLVSSTYDVLFQTVYGPDAYWGTDFKARRMTTLQRTGQAIKYFDRAVMAFLEFGKGVITSLETTPSDANFRKKYTSSFRDLLQKRNDITAKAEALHSEINSVTATVKSLLEVARTVPRAVSELTILVQANKAILFKVSKTSSSSLPVITKNEVKSRPLPEIPQALQLLKEVKEGDYAIPTDQEERERRQQHLGLKNYTDTVIDSGTISRKRNPHDELPPLPYAGTLPKSHKSPGNKKRSLDQQLYQTQQQQQQQYQQPPPPRTGSPFNSPYHSRTNLPPQNAGRKRLESGEDYDEIIEGRERSFAISSRTSLTSGGSSRGESPILRMRREHSLSSGSGSCEDITQMGLRRANSADLLDGGPYGRGFRSNHQRQASSPQPLRDEDRELLERFCKQFDLIIPNLKESVDIFSDCIRDNEPPKDFVTKGKLTVVAAYKLVYVADTLTQKILHNETKAAILASSNRLTDSIKSLVSDTKTAALQFPSVIALEKMNGSLHELHPTALDLVNLVKSHAALVA